MRPILSTLAAAALLSLALPASAQLRSTGDACASGPATPAAAGPLAGAVASLGVNLPQRKPAALALAAVGTGNELLCLTEDKPEQGKIVGIIAPLSGSDVRIVGIDYRPQDGLLYALGDGGGIYTVDTATARATRVSQLTVALSGTAFGMDFNPAADRLRIISNNGQNLRHNVNAGGVTLTDAFIKASAAATAPLTGFGTLAYTNNDVANMNIPQAGLTGTTMFVINAVSNTVAIQSPPNDGLIANTGALGITNVGPVGMDIYSTVVNGAAVANRAFVSYTAQGESISRLAELDLLTGRAAAGKPFQAGVTIVDIAVPLYQNNK